MLSAQKLERLHKSLLDEQAHLREEIQHMSGRTSQDESLGLGNHMAEDATAAFEQATQVSLKRGEELRLEQVDRALERMQDGTYGLCERCEQEIDFARLKAIPDARLCLPCQKLVEQ